MESYKVRVFSHDESKLNEFLARYSPSVSMIAYEGTVEVEDGKVKGARPHVHMFIRTDKKRPAMTAYLRKEFGAGNKFWSMKLLDEEFPLEYIGYMMKEDRWTATGIGDEVLTKAKDHNAKVVKEMKEKKLIKRMTVLQSVDATCFGDMVSTPMDTNNVWVNKEGETLSKKDVVERVLDYYVKSGGLIRKFFIVSLCQTLCLKYVGSYQRELASSIFDGL